MEVGFGSKMLLVLEPSCETGIANFELPVCALMIRIGAPEAPPIDVTVEAAAAALPAGMIMRLKNSNLKKLA